jgi:hypothetical protein
MDGTKESNEKLTNLLQIEGFEIYGIGQGCGVRCETIVWKRVPSK